MKFIVITIFSLLLASCENSCGNLQNSLSGASDKKGQTTKNEDSGKNTDTSDPPEITDPTASDPPKIDTEPPASDTPKTDVVDTEITKDVNNTTNIPQEVITLAKIGLENYKKEPLISERKQALANNTTGGGRKGDWIKKTLGKSENELIEDLKKIDPPKTITLKDLNNNYEEAINKKARDMSHKPKFILVKGVGVNYLHDSELGKDAIVQLASQFNYLESMSSDKSLVSTYLNDRTQGPQGSIESLSAALHRFAAEDSGKLKHALHSLFGDKDVSKFYKNGYLELFKLNENEQKEILQNFNDNIDKLEILAQPAICEASDSFQIQVFSAAPSYQGKSKPPKDGSAGAKICDLLVSSQYEAIAKLGVTKSIEENKPIKIHLTLVGQGAFNNPNSVIKTALAKVADITQGYPDVTVFIHAFGDKDEKIIKEQQTSEKFDLKKMSKDDFMK